MGIGQNPRSSFWGPLLLCVKQLWGTASAGSTWPRGPSPPSLGECTQPHWEGQGHQRPKKELHSNRSSARAE